MGRASRAPEPAAHAYCRSWSFGDGDLSGEGRVGTVSGCQWCVGSTCPTPTARGPCSAPGVRRLALGRGEGASPQVLVPVMAKLPAQDSICWAPEALGRVVILDTSTRLAAVSPQLRIGARGPGRGTVRGHIPFRPGPSAPITRERGERPSTWGRRRDGAGAATCSWLVGRTM